MAQKALRTMSAAWKCTPGDLLVSSAPIPNSAFSCIQRNTRPRLIALRGSQYIKAIPFNAPLPLPPAAFPRVVPDPASPLRLSQRGRHQCVEALLNPRPGTPQRGQPHSPQATCAPARHAPRLPLTCRQRLPQRRAQEALHRNCVEGGPPWRHQTHVLLPRAAPLPLRCPAARPGRARRPGARRPPCAHSSRARVASSAATPRRPPRSAASRSAAGEPLLPVYAHELPPASS